MEKPTVVIFRKYKKSKDILALFPYEIDTPLTCTCYEHVGQHGGANYHHCISITTPAKPDEYAALKAELESIGYNLKIQTRK